MEWDLLIYLIVVIIVAIYKLVVEFNNIVWYRSLRKPLFSLSLIPFNLFSFIAFVFLALAVYRADHAYDGAGIIRLPKIRQLEQTIRTAISAAFLLTIFHFIVWVNQFFNNRNPPDAFYSGVIFLVMIFVLLIIFAVTDVWAAVMMIPVAIWSVYVLWLNLAIIQLNNFNCTVIREDVNIDITETFLTR